MGTLSYPYTITDAQWFDAVPVTADYLALKNVLNGGLDQNNFSATMDPVLDDLALDDCLIAESIQPAASLSIAFANGKAFVFRLQSTPATEYLRIEAGEGTI